MIWISLAEGIVAARNCFKYLLPGGRLRIAIPDVNWSLGNVLWIEKNGRSEDKNGYIVNASSGESVSDSNDANGDGTYTSKWANSKVSDMRVLQSMVLDGEMMGIPVTDETSTDHSTVIHRTKLLMKARVIDHDIKQKHLVQYSASSIQVCCVSVQYVYHASCYVLHQQYTTTVVVHVLMRESDNTFLCTNINTTVRLDS